MTRRMVLMVTMTVVLALLLGPLRAQQTALTEDQIRSAKAEMPELSRLLEIGPGSVVADIGAGFGAWTIEFSRLVGPSGRVYATDVGDAQLASLGNTIATERLTNVVVLAGAVDATNLPTACCDAALIRDAYHHFTAPESLVRSVAAALKPRGRLVVIDFPTRPNSERPVGVPANRGGHGIPPEIVTAEVGAVFTHVRTQLNWTTSSTQNTLFMQLFRKP